MRDAWPEIPIAEIGRVVTGKTPSTKCPNLYGEKYPFITPTDIFEEYDVATPSRFLSQEGFDLQKSLLLPRNAVCFTCIASIGKMCITVEPSFTNQQINSIIVDESRHDYRFVFHALSLARERIRGFAGGAATPIINKSDFSQVRLPIPPLEVQRGIVKSIAPYDLLIDNLRRRNGVLRRTRDLLLSKFILNGGAE